MSLFKCEPQAAAKYYKQKNLCEIEGCRDIKHFKLVGFHSRPQLTSLTGSCFALFKRIKLN